MDIKRVGDHVIVTFSETEYKTVAGKYRQHAYKEEPITDQPGRSVEVNGIKQTLMETKYRLFIHRKTFDLYLRDSKPSKTDNDKEEIEL